jgi:hypothetical protein
MNIKNLMPILLATSIFFHMVFPDFRVGSYMHEDMSGGVYLMVCAADDCIFDFQYSLEDFSLWK